MVDRVALLSLHSSPLARIGTSDAGGMNVYVRRLAAELETLGVTADIFTRRTSADIPEVVMTEEGTRVIHLTAGPSRPVPKSALPLYVPSLVDAFQCFVRREAVDYSVLHSHYWLSGTVALRTDHAPVAHMFHTLARVKELYSGSPDPTDSALRADGEHRVMETADAIVVATAAERQHMECLYRVELSSCWTIPPGVDLGLFRPSDKDVCRRELGIDAARVVLFVGRLDPIKGLDTLLYSAARLPDSVKRRTKLVVVGDSESSGPIQRLRYSRLVQRLNLDDVVIFRDLLPHRELAAYYAAADLCAVPSAYESFGMVAVEAMACGTPVIGFDVGCLSTTVRDSDTGYLAQPANHADFGAKLLEALTSSDLSAMGVRARASVWRYNWPTIAARTLQLYSHLAEAADLTATACQSV